MNPQTKKHLIPCKHCGKEVLDHMDLCPFCGQRLRCQVTLGSWNLVLKIGFWILALALVVHRIWFK